jgi:hypothetical protein
VSILFPVELHLFLPYYKCHSYPLLINKPPPFTNGETVKKIKEGIKQNRKFVLLATNKAINSKWCNWELDFCDPHKYIDQVAPFPSLKTQTLGMVQNTSEFNLELKKATTPTSIIK